MTHGYNCSRNSATGYSPYYLMFGREPRLPIDVEFGLFKGQSTLPPSKSMYIQKLKQRLLYAHKKAQKYSDKQKSRHKGYYDKRNRGAQLKLNDIVLVRVVAHTGRHKIQDKWEEDEYKVLSQPNDEIPVYKVQKTNGQGRIRVLHRNLLLPLGSRMKSNEQVEEMPVSFSEEMEEDLTVIPEGPGVKKHQPVNKDKATKLVTFDISREDMKTNHSIGKNTEEIVNNVVEDSSSSELLLTQDEQLTEDSARDDAMQLPDDSTISSHVSDTTYNTSRDRSEQSTEDSSEEKDSSAQPEMSDLNDVTPPMSFDVDNLTGFLEDTPENDDLLESVESPTESQFSSIMEYQQSDESEAEDMEDSVEAEIPPVEIAPRRSTRSTRGSVPHRYGPYVTHASHATVKHKVAECDCKFCKLIEPVCTVM